LNIGPQNSDYIDAIEYWLNLEDIYPSSTGLITHGLDVVRRALGKLGVISESTKTFESRIEMKTDRSLDSKETAVLERLVYGDLEILSNTLVGSPQILKSLFDKECIIYVPYFNHLGVDLDFVVHGSYDVVKQIVQSTVESTLFKCSSDAYAVVSTPSSWRQPLLQLASDSNLEIWPIVSVRSNRRLLRDERTFHDEKKLLRWSDGTS
jgi:hypothetical protein